MMAPGYMGHSPEIPNFDIGSIGIQPCIIERQGVHLYMWSEH
jgi:hypothetical protein